MGIFNKTYNPKQSTGKILVFSDKMSNFQLQKFDSMLTFFFLKVMTPNPECATLDTTILEALHIMHDGKFLHLPVVDRGEL